MKGPPSCYIAIAVVALAVTTVVACLMYTVHRNRCDCEFAEAVANSDYRTVALQLRRGASPDVDVYRFTASDCSREAWALILDPPKPVGCPALVYTLFPVFSHGDIGNTKMARLLLEAHADPNAPNQDGNTPLIVASSYGNEKAVRLLLARGANRSAVNDRGQTALDAARGSGHEDIVSILSAK